jgi:O-antigen ligase
MFTDRPVEGFGSGSFAERYRAREHIGSKRTVAVSHTIPVTVAAEQGAIGLLAYLALLLLAFRLLLGGLREGLRSETPGAAVLARLAVAAAFAGLVLHTFLYAAFLEDPLAWALLGLSAALAPAAIDRKF